MRRDVLRGMPRSINPHLLHESFDVCSVRHAGNTLVGGMLPQSTTGPPTTPKKKNGTYSSLSLEDLGLGNCLDAVFVDLRL